MQATRNVAPLLKSGTLGLATLAVLGLAAPHPALAQTNYFTGFEPPAYVAGAPLDGQNGWTDDGYSGGVVSTINPKSGVQDLVFHGSDLAYSAPDGLYIGRADPGVVVDGSVDTIVNFSADVEVAGPQTFPAIDGDDFSGNLNVYNSTNNLGEMYISSDGHAYSDVNNDYYEFGQPVTLDKYHNLGMKLDFTTLMTSYYLDGSYLGSLAMPASAATDKTIVPVLTAYGIADGGGYSHADYTDYFDNVSVVGSHASVAPEPSPVATVGLVALFVGGLMLKARKRQKSAG